MNDPWVLTMTPPSQLFTLFAGQAIVTCRDGVWMTESRVISQDPSDRKLATETSGAESI